MNHYFFHHGNYDSIKAYPGEDKKLGYPALVAIKNLKPDYFIGTGDNVYFDHPNKGNFDWAIKSGKNPHPAGYDGKEVMDEEGMRNNKDELVLQFNYAIGAHGAHAF